MAYVTQKHNCNLFTRRINKTFPSTLLANFESSKFIGRMIFNCIIHAKEDENLNCFIERAQRDDLSNYIIRQQDFVRFICNIKAPSSDSLTVCQYTLFLKLPDIIFIAMKRL